MSLHKYPALFQNQRLTHLKYFQHLNCASVMTMSKEPVLAVHHPSAAQHAKKEKHLRAVIITLRAQKQSVIISSFPPPRVGEAIYPSDSLPSLPRSKQGVH